MSVLSIRNVHKSFKDKNVLKGLSLEVPERSLFGFVGKNGAGKTTTMKSVLGLITIDSGEIYVSGEKVEYGKSATNRHIGYLPDVPEFYSFYNAREYLKFFAGMSGIDDKDTSDRIEELLSLVGLSDEKHRIKGYSRGMKQRLGIAQALLSRPRLLICDEPTSALDPIGRREILDVISDVSSQTTVFFSTHILSDVERICTDVAFINDGVITVEGKLSDIKRKYRKDEYAILAESIEDGAELLRRFKKMTLTNERELLFSCRDYELSEVLAYITEKNINLLRLERVEPSLESLFVEVTDK